MKKHGFSMIELVFVIVILGVLAAVAVPRFIATRMDTMVATYRNEVSTIMKTVPTVVFAQDINFRQEKPDDADSWAEWMMKNVHLDSNRWYAYDKYLSPIWYNDDRTSYKTMCGLNSSGKAPIEFDNTNGQLIFNPDNFDGGMTSESNALCLALMNSYASGSNRVIPLNSANDVKF